MVVADPDKKHASRIFFVVIALFVIGALVYITPPNEFPEHSVVDNLNSLFYGFSALMQSDIEGFFDGLVGGLPVIAIFMVLFSLMHYLFSHVLRPIFPKKKHATILALVMALYGFYDHRIYNQLLSLNAFAIGALVFSALVIMIWGFTEKNVTQMRKELKELYIKQQQGKAQQNDIDKIKELIRDITREERIAQAKQSSSSHARK